MLGEKTQACSQNLLHRRLYLKGILGAGEDIPLSTSMKAEMKLRQAHPAVHSRQLCML